MHGKGHFVFINVTTESKTSWAESVCGKAKQNYHLGAAAELVLNQRKTRKMGIVRLGYRYQPAKKDKVFTLL